MREIVETRIGTSVIETPKRLYNPVTEKYVRMENLSEDGYCRKFLAMLYSQNGGVNKVNLSSSPVCTFDKDKWKLQEQEGQFVMVKKEAETAFDELVMNEADTAGKAVSKPTDK